MLETLAQAWRARRAVVIGEEEGLRPWLSGLLEALGAQTLPMKLPEGREALSRAMQTGRCAAVILAQLPGENGLQGHLEALDRVLTEAREAGVPQVILCSDAEVYRGEGGAWYPDEHSAVGGRTQEGLFGAIAQLYADGFSRGLLGDAVTTLIVRHMPCLGCGGESVHQYDAWCRDLLAERAIEVEDPEQQGVFVHPLDAACGALALGAYGLLRREPLGGTFNLGAGARNLSANRSAALRLLRRCGRQEADRTERDAGWGKPLLLNGSRARRLCGVRCRLSGDEALDARFRLLSGQEDAARQVLHYLKAMRQEEGRPQG